jgi:hypothetical protein
MQRFFLFNKAKQQKAWKRLIFRVFLYDLTAEGKVQGSGFRVPGSGFRVQGSGFRVQGSGFKV